MTMIEILLGILAVAVFVCYILPTLLVLLVVVIAMMFAAVVATFEWLGTLWKK